MHPRRTPFNGNVAHSSLIGRVDAELFTDGEERQINVPIADLLREPGGRLDRQLLLGTGFLVLTDDPATGLSFGQSALDGYVGYVVSDHLAEPKMPTHKVAVFSSHVYSAADLKSRALYYLPQGATLSIASQAGGYAKLQDGGFVPFQHLQPIDWVADDFVSVFEMFLGVPYLWGGNSVWGMDCSGAVQLALHMAGKTCPPDAGMQAVELGKELEDNETLQRGDVIFWAGHVGVMQDRDTLIHANAHHMAVASEPLANAVARIIQKGDGPVTSRRRI